MFIIRWLLGRIILLLNFIFSPKKLKRTESAQAEIDLQTKSLQLYQYQACPFCVKVRRSLRRQGLNIVIVDAKQADNKKVLQSQAGKIQVPCLRIEENNKVTWLYESSAIIDYLTNRFA
ncbi:glutathione S-transferase N-terminal domain-containing protein [Psychromonas antarctica]|jgi:glutaredoxin|uniref:glutathione S-transferase N-terminal domain-containing protein n=1 Tax=Psychromonas antarctica TaxID=67573 RepID=UPI001EE92B1C|nr:glutathione S-transferase N-terminal domain-containing protein [Psychromonas antarctica]MCG6200065.1 glutathione S-transferase N-terminal domain-containing protein [Psychromonas antarctica]